MPRASKFIFREEKFRELQEHFSHLISSLNDLSETESFFDEFLTREEKIMLTKRLVIFMMIKRNYPAGVIKDILHISHETVRYYQNQLPSKSERFQKLIDRLIGREKTKEFFQRLEKLLKPLDLAMKARNDMRARARIASGY